MQQILCALYHESCDAGVTIVDAQDRLIEDFLDVRDVAQVFILSPPISITKDKTLSQTLEIGFRYSR